MPTHTPHHSIFYQIILSKFTLYYTINLYCVILYDIASYLYHSLRIIWGLLHIIHRNAEDKQKLKPVAKYWGSLGLMAYSIQRLETKSEVMIGSLLVQLNICTCKHCSRVIPSHHT